MINIDKLKIIEQKKCKKYFTLNNGGYKFIVEDYGNKVIIYNILEDDDYKINNGQKIKEIKYQEIFFGKPSPKILLDYEIYKKGNSILLQINKGIYIFIGTKIFSFTTNDKEKIIKFISPIGHSSVPYPYAIGEKYTYLLVENVYLDNSLLDLSNDVYTQYYQKTYIMDELIFNKKISTIKTKKYYNN